LKSGEVLEADVHRYLDLVTSFPDEVPLKSNRNSDSR